MADIRQSPFWALFMEELGWNVYKLGPDKKNFLFARKLPVLGNLVKAPRISTPLPLAEIDNLAKEIKAFFVKIEPDCLVNDIQNLKELKTSGFHQETWSLHPTKTILIDLRKSEEELLLAMEKDTRYSVRAAQRRGVRVVKSNDLNRFLTLYRETAQRKKFSIAAEEMKVLWNIFANEGKAFILIAQWNKVDIAACLILHYEKTAYYFHAASKNIFRELFAPYLLIWETMLTAKKLHLKELDLEGVYDHRIPSTKNWRGFSHFKRGFGGEEKIFLGSFVKHYSLVSKVIALPNRVLKI